MKKKRQDARKRFEMKCILLYVTRCNYYEVNIAANAMYRS